MTCFGSLNSKSDSEMSFANTRRTKQYNILSPLDEAKSGEFSNHLTVNAGLEGIIELFQCFGPR